MADIQVLEENFREKCSVPDDPYGYEMAAPDADKYGYEDTSRDSTAEKYEYGGGGNPYGYETDPPDAKYDYGYGDASPNHNDLGYEDAAPDSGVNYGYEDAQPDDDERNGDGAPTKSRTTPLRNASGLSTSSRQDRPRRRGSVTKYTLETAEAVRKEQEDQEQQDDRPEMLNQNWNGVTIDDISVPLKDDLDEAGDSKHGKKKSLGRFRIGRNRSGVSAASTKSSSSKN